MPTFFSCYFFSDLYHFITEGGARIKNLSSLPLLLGNILFNRVY